MARECSTLGHAAQAPIQCLYVEFADTSRTESVVLDPIASLQLGIKLNSRQPAC